MRGRLSSRHRATFARTGRVRTNTGGPRRPAAWTTRGTSATATLAGTFARLVRSGQIGRSAVPNRAMHFHTRPKIDFVFRINIGEDFLGFR